MAEDKYSDFDHLKAAEPAKAWRAFASPRQSDVVVIAPHGGGIEQGTSELAVAIAGQSLSLYVFEGLKGAGNADLHVTSSNFDEPLGVDLVNQTRTVLAIHGERNDKVEVIYLGGLDQVLGAVLGEKLASAGFVVQRHKKPSMQGIAKANICNRGSSGKGVQLELSKGLRRKFFMSMTPIGRQQPTERFHAFVSAVRNALGLSP